MAMIEKRGWITVPKLCKKIAGTFQNYEDWKRENNIESPDHGDPLGTHAQYSIEKSNYITRTAWKVLTNSQKLCGLENSGNSVEITKDVLKGAEQFQQDSFYFDLESGILGNGDIERFVWTELDEHKGGPLAEGCKYEGENRKGYSRLDDAEKERLNKEHLGQAIGLSVIIRDVDANYWINKFSKLQSPLKRGAKTKYDPDLVTTPYLKSRRAKRSKAKSIQDVQIEFEKRGEKPPSRSTIQRLVKDAKVNDQAFN